MENDELKDKQAQTEATENAEAQAGEQAEQTAEQVEEPEVDPRDAKIEELNNRLLRLQADFANFRRRTATEKEELSSFVTANVVGSFLKVLDNFERAEAVAQKANDMEGMLKGLAMIRRQFDDTFKALNVEEIPAQDQKFDPKLHEAVMRAANPDLEDETIDMVLEKGYKVGDKVIRHSKVRVINND